MSETQQTQNQAEPQPGTPEYDESMVRKWAQANVNALPPEAKGDPENFVKMFMDTKAHATRLAQENAQLKNQGTQPQTTQQTQQTQQTTQSGNPLSIPEDDPTAAQQSGVDWGAVQQEVMRSGKMSDQTRQALVKAGIPEAFIRTTEQGYQALIKQQYDAAISVVGGEENFKRLQAWAKANLSPEEKSAINQSLSGPQATTVLMGLWARYQATGPGAGESPEVGTENAIESTNARPFDNPAEMVAAMSDPRYKYRTDEQYCRMVEARARATSVTTNKSYKRSG